MENVEKVVEKWSKTVKTVKNSQNGENTEFLHSQPVTVRKSVKTDSPKSGVLKLPKVVFY